MNEELLDTYVVKSDITRWLNDGKTLTEILFKLEDIQLIVISEEELKNFIETKHLNSNESNKNKENKQNKKNNK